jgi:tetratricopeptide (TPR) repeat protein
MNGDLIRARQLNLEADAILDDLGRLQSTVSHHEASVELLAGEPAAAELTLSRGYHRLEAMGEQSLLATTAAMLAQAAFARGDYDAAFDYSVASERSAAPDDLSAQVIWRGARAKILALRGDYGAAEMLAREAVRLTEPNDFVTVRADALFDLGDTLDCAGKGVEAEDAVRDALELYVAKGNVVSAERARSWLGTRASAIDTHG